MSHLQACQIARNGEGFYQFADGVIFNVLLTPGYFALHRDESGLVTEVRKIAAAALPIGFPSDQQLKMIENNHALAEPDLESHCLDCGPTKFIIFEGENVQPGQPGGEFLDQRVFQVSPNYFVLPPTYFNLLPLQKISTVYLASAFNENILQLFRKSGEKVESYCRAYESVKRLMQLPFFLL